jgi:hypothetical protein
MGGRQTATEQSRTSMGLGTKHAMEAAARLHADDRLVHAFGAHQVIAEFRALRASVLRGCCRSHRSRTTNGRYRTPPWRTLKAAAAVANCIPAQSFQVRAGDIEVPAVQLALEFAHQTLKSTPSSNRLAQRPRTQRREIDRDRFSHAEHDTDAP